MAVLAPLLIATSARTWRAMWPGLIGTAVTTALLVGPYALVYMRSSQAVGTRTWEDVGWLSATWSSYLASPGSN